LSVVASILKAVIHFLPPFSTTTPVTALAVAPWQ